MELESFNGKLSCFLIILILSFSAIAEKRTVAIIIPSANPKISEIYAKIVKGIKQSTPFLKTESRILTNDNQEQIKNWLLASQLIAVVAIGEKTTDLANLTLIDTPLLTTGTLLSSGQHIPGVSLSLSENVLKKYLSLYLPNIQTLHVGNDNKNIIWLIDSVNGPKIKHKNIGNDPNKIVKYLWQTINDINPKKEAVWINSNIDHYFLYKLSERAWERNVVLISSNIKHLESGVLLAFHPNFYAMGGILGEMINQLPNNKKLDLEPLTTIHKGINLRTSKHLGLHFSPEMQSQFSVIIK